MKNIKGKEFYLKDGKLDLSILDEPIYIKEDNILEQIEVISSDTESQNISETLEEMAMIFGIEKDDDADNKQVDIFDEKVLKKEMKEFNM